MQKEQKIAAFFKAIGNDPRIGANHISLYCALFQMELQQDVEPLFIMGRDIMKVSKISGLATYHKCIRDLNDFGYILYKPSRNHRKKSKVFLPEKFN